MFLKSIMIGGAMFAAALPAAAQERGTVEFGAFASAGTFNKTLTLDKGVGAGGHVGVYLDPRWAVEFEKGEMRASRTLGLADVNVGILTARLVATPIKSGAFSMHIGAGAGGSTETNFMHTYTANAVVGAKVALSNFAAIRVDAISSWLANYNWKSNQRLQAGLSFYRSPTTHVTPAPYAPAAPACNCMQQHDSVSAAEQDRRRRFERDYNAVRDSLNRNPPRLNSPAAAPVSSVETRLAMEDRIHFAFDKSDLTPESKAILDEKVAIFVANPTMTIEISGNTDKMGTEQYNVGLGMRRAEAARAYMVSKGIAASRIQIESLGESNPAVSPTAIGVAQNAPNRRDNFRLIVVPDVVKKP